MSDRQNSNEDEEANRDTVPARPKSYYYDDSTGYETYDGEDDPDDGGNCEDESES